MANAKVMLDRSKTMAALVEFCRKRRSRKEITEHFKNEDQNRLASCLTYLSDRKGYIKKIKTDKHYDYLTVAPNEYIHIGRRMSKKARDIVGSQQDIIPGARVFIMDDAAGEDRYNRNKGSKGLTQPHSAWIGSSMNMV